NSEQQEYTDTIRSSGDALLTVINDILDFSKIESGNLEIENRPFDLRQCVERVMDVFGPKAAEKNLDLLYEIDHLIPTEIMGDSHRVRQILLNLISNAMKFTHQGEIVLGVSLRNLSTEHLELAFSIRDTGIGIPQDKLSRLFKAFSQVDSSTTRKYGGTGLGLVISERLVGLMNGSIEVKSEAGVGTTFTFTIKCLVDKENLAQPFSHSRSDMEQKKVLLVEDNETHLRILHNSLTRWKMITTLASSGEQALKILSQSPDFDLVITDMQMPDMDGMKLAQRIKSIYTDLPIILLNSLSDETNANSAGLFFSVIKKPIKQAQLNREILRAVKLEVNGEKGTIVKEVDQKITQLLSVDFAAKYPLRILLAEDNPVNQKLALRVLSKLGYNDVGVAQNGMEVIEKFDEQFYDVVLMDIQMPEMDGLEATRLIRSKHYHQPLIISMTANVMAEDKEACRLAGMDDYISKPVKLEILVEMLEKWAVRLKEKLESRE
ncbi:MAG: histidine kinase, partial [Marivirga sp.]|nr:histidine kinase [Marivirga sp.]